MIRKAGFLWAIWKNSMMKKLSQLKSKMAEISQKMQSFHSKIQIVSKKGPDAIETLYKWFFENSTKHFENARKNKNSSKKLENWSKEHKVSANPPDVVIEKRTYKARRKGSSMKSFSISVRFLSLCEALIPLNSIEVLVLNKKACFSYFIFGRWRITRSPLYFYELTNHAFCSLAAQLITKLMTTLRQSSSPIKFSKLETTLWGI